MKERDFLFYGGHIKDFISSLSRGTREKFAYALLLLRNQSRISTKWIKYINDGIYEIRIEFEGNIYRVFFIFDESNTVVLLNGFQKKSIKTPQSEFNIAQRLKKEYYEDKRTGRI